MQLTIGLILIAAFWNGLKAAEISWTTYNSKHLFANDYTTLQADQATISVPVWHLKDRKARPSKKTVGIVVKRWMPTGTGIISRHIWLLTGGPAGTKAATFWEQQGNLQNIIGKHFSGSHGIAFFTIDPRGIGKSQKISKTKATLEEVIQARKENCTGVVPLASVNTAVAARDLNFIVSRVSAGKQAFLIGIEYGATIAVHAISQAPTLYTAAILDSLNTHRFDFTNLAVTGATLVDNCKRNRECREEFERVGFKGSKDFLEFVASLATENEVSKCSKSFYKILLKDPGFSDQSKIEVDSPCNKMHGIFGALLRQGKWAMMAVMRMILAIKECADRRKVKALVKETLSHVVLDRSPIYMIPGTNIFANHLISTFEEWGLPETLKTCMLTKSSCPASLVDPCIPVNYYGSQMGHFMAHHPGKLIPFPPIFPQTSQTRVIILEGILDTTNPSPATQRWAKTFFNGKSFILYEFANEQQCILCSETCGTDLAVDLLNGSIKAQKCITQANQGTLDWKFERIAKDEKGNMSEEQSSKVAASSNNNDAANNVIPKGTKEPAEKPYLNVKGITEPDEESSLNAKGKGKPKADDKSHLKLILIIFGSIAAIALVCVLAYLGYIFSRKDSAVSVQPVQNENDTFGGGSKDRIERVETQNNSGLDAPFDDGMQRRSGGLATPTIELPPGKKKSSGLFERFRKSSTAPLPIDTVPMGKPVPPSQSIPPPPSIPPMQPISATLPTATTTTTQQQSVRARGSSGFARNKASNSADVPRQPSFVGQPGSVPPKMRPSISPNPSPIGGGSASAGVPPSRPTSSSITAFNMPSLRTSSIAKKQ